MEDLTYTALTRRMTVLEVALARLQAEKDALESETQVLTKVAYQDPLTGLGNRRFLDQRVTGRLGFLVMADLDGFKRAQDAHPRGHAYGDDILIEFAEFLLSETRSGTGRAGDRVAARIGGDEFAVWCPNRGGALRIRNVIRLWRSIDGAVGASAGIGMDLPSADASLYLHKNRRVA